MGMAYSPERTAVICLVKSVLGDDGHDEDEAHPDHSALHSDLKLGFVSYFGGFS